MYIAIEGKHQSFPIELNEDIIIDLLPSAAPKNSVETPRLTDYCLQFQRFHITPVSAEIR